MSDMDIINLYKIIGTRHLNYQFGIDSILLI